VLTQSNYFAVDNFSEFRLKMLNWSNRFSIFCMLDNQQYSFNTPAFECILAAGCKKSISASAGNAFTALQQFCNDHNGWLFGHLGYDLKNETEALVSKNRDGIGFADMFFFEPELVVKLCCKGVEITGTTNPEAVFKEIMQEPVQPGTTNAGSIKPSSRFTKEDYIEAVKKIQQHIVRGDCYVLNFCQEFFAEDVVLNPVDIYKKLITISPNPFSALYRVNERWCICASPERYIKKEGNRILSQPIKGTAGRHLLDELKDEASRQYLQESEKEKSENVMVVDLVRNDLSKICREGSVKAEDLFGIYSFPQVHQMVSTVTGELKADVDFAAIIKATFPMGSMTGAPKKRVLELVEQYERTKRGLFSGAIGYINPGGDFDFNVVIRSILYNHANRYLSIQTGGAITFYSDAEKEYEECMLKAKAMMQVLQDY
jgi:para-aminobenzoate synthetase component 1